jgi:hypothetical protein
LLGLSEESGLLVLGGDCDVSVRSSLSRQLFGRRCFEGSQVRV